MKRILFATTTVLALAGTSASAADLPRREPPIVKAPVLVPEPGYNWTGFYLGINGGGGWGRSNFDGTFGTPDRFNTSGALIGGTLGYNLQFGQIVLGVEGDLDWSNIRGTAGCFAGVVTCETRNDWLGTARGRVGLAFDRLLPYVTGGLAVGDVNTNAAGLGSSSSTNAGWTVGAGLEFALSRNWSAKAEYLHVDLGNATCSPVCGPATTTTDFNANVVRGGVNFRF